MSFYRFSLCFFLLKLLSAHAWVSLAEGGRGKSCPHFVAPTNSDSGSVEATPVDLEISSGRILEGGKVLDFSAVKASEKAEDALRSARERILDLQVQCPDCASSEILGINEDVVKEVGHSLAQFATTEEIQACAAWIRADAPVGLFQRQTGFPSECLSHSFSDVERFKTILKKSFEEAGEVTSAFAKTFYMGTMLLGQEAREAIWAIYVWCRRTDEIVDAPRDSNEDMLRDLSLWEARLENLWSYGEVVDVFDLTLLQVRVKYPSLEITPFMDMIRGMLMDVPGLGRDRYDRFDELHLYCYRVAGTVGLMSLPIFGCAEGFTAKTARYVKFSQISKSHPCLTLSSICFGTENQPCHSGWHFS